MTLFQYIEGIPASGNDPSTDQPNMLINTNNIANLIEEDHIGFNANQGGQHNVIRFFNQSVDPVNITSPPTGQQYAKNLTPSVGIADTQLFFETATGIISQLTGSVLTNTATSDGYAWTGGILLQWGFVSITGTSSTSGTVTFANRVPNAIAFPNNCFCVLCSISFPSSPSTIVGSSVGVNGGSVTKTSFHYNYANVGGTSSNTGFYWLAVGN